MNYSRRQLERHGEPLGECVTRPKLGGGYICGGGGGGGSSSSSTETRNEDKRLAVSSGAGITGDNSSISVISTDGGIVARALDSVDASNAMNAEGFDKLLDASTEGFSNLLDANTRNFSTTVGSQTQGFSQLIGAAERLFNQGQNLIGTTQKSVADAYSQAQANKSGTIDNRTIIVLAVAGAAAAFAITRKK